MHFTRNVSICRHLLWYDMLHHHSPNHYFSLKVKNTTHREYFSNHNKTICGRNVAPLFFFLYKNKLFRNYFSVFYWNSYHFMLFNHLFYLQGTWRGGKLLKFQSLLCFNSAISSRSKDKVHFLQNMALNFNFIRKHK